MGTLAGIVAGLVILSLSAPYLIAGYGVLNRKQWGRLLTLVLAGLHGFLALGSAMKQDLGFLFTGSYFVFAFVVLLDRRYRAEFDASESVAHASPPSRVTRRLKRSVSMASRSKAYLVFMGGTILILLFLAALLVRALL